MTSSMFIRRSQMIFLLYCLAFSLLTVRLYWLQVLNNEKLTSMAVASNSLHVLLDDFPRGEIVDRDGYSLTGEVIENRLVVLPLLLEDKLTTADWLAALLGRPREEVQQALAAGGVLPYALSREQVEAVREKKVAGLMVVPYRLRYGTRPLAVHVVGHLKKSTGNSWVGVSGLEVIYDDVLRRDYEPGEVRLQLDARGRPVGLPEIIPPQMSSRCRVVTTIDARYQALVEKVMDEKVPVGAVLVMDAANGDIRAIASRPNYHPHPSNLARALQVHDRDVFIDQATSLFPPGSVFKVVVAAAALSEGLATPTTVFHCSGAADRLLPCHKKEGHGDINLLMALAESCNPVFAQLALQLGPEKIIYYARLLGLDYQEIIGYKRKNDPRQQWELVAKSYNLINASIGQGPVLATPVQIAVMMAVIANGGYSVVPRLVERVEQAEGKVVRDYPSIQPRRVLSPATVRSLQQMLMAATTTGLGREAWVVPGGSAGKTGTAQVVGGNDAWFVGYLPVEHPRYVIVVLVRGKGSGATVAAPVFRAIGEGIIKLEAMGARSGEKT